MRPCRRAGLDSASAFFCIEALRKLASQGRAVVMSVHQPSAEAFELFDSLILLSRGRMIYAGAAAECDSALLVALWTVRRGNSRWIWTCALVLVRSERARARLRAFARFQNDPQVRRVLRGRRPRLPAASSTGRSLSLHHEHGLPECDRLLSAAFHRLATAYALTPSGSPVGSCVASSKRRSGPAARVAANHTLSHAAFAADFAGADSTALDASTGDIEAAPAPVAVPDAARGIEDLAALFEKDLRVRLPLWPTSGPLCRRCSLEHVCLRTSHALCRPRACGAKAQEAASATIILEPTFGERCGCTPLLARAPPWSRSCAHAGALRGAR